MSHSMPLGLIELSTNVLWLLPPVLIALVLFRYYRSKRQEIFAGSLMLWRRVAAHQPKSPPKRFRIDRSFVLQALALAGLIGAVAAPRWVLASAHGRTLLLVVDNGPLARAVSDKQQLWKSVQFAAETALKNLKSGDRVRLICSAPIPRELTDGPVTSSDALNALNQIHPALSGPSAADLWSYTVDQARSHGRSGSSLPLRVISLQGAPSGNPSWLCVSPRNEILENTAIVAFGSALVGHDTVQVLARVRNCGEKSVRGGLKIENFPGSDGATAQEKKLTLAARSEEAVTFTLTRNLDLPIKVSWNAEDGGFDALPDDNIVIATPRAIRPPRVRFHSELPALEKLYQKALDAAVLKATDLSSADLDIYAGSVPDSVPETRGVLLLAPASGYRSFFEVGPKQLEWPTVEHGDKDPLSEGVGNIPVPKAVELIQTGNLRVLLKASEAKSTRIIAARFDDEHQRNGYVFAFVPGVGYAPDHPLEPNAAAMLIRIALQAADAGEPYSAQRAEVFERKINNPLQPQWFEKVEPGTGLGVLNEKTSALVLPDPGKPVTGDPFAAVSSVLSNSDIDLAPGLVLIALVLLAVELWLEYSADKRAIAGRAAVANTMSL